MEFTPIQPPENFDLWLLEYHNKTIKNIFNEIAPYKNHIPNFEYFVYNFFDYGFGFIGGIGGFFENLNLVEDKTTIKKTNFYLEQYIRTFNELTKDFSNIEKSFYYKILENYFFDLINSTEQNLHHYEYDICNDLHKYFELKFNQNKHILPFTIHYKKNIIVENDENPDLNWFIMKNTDANRTISNYPELITEVRQNENTLNWNGTELQFAEIVKALIETKLVSPEINQKEFFKKMKVFFNVKDFNESDKLKDIRKRTITQTPFINILETALNNWITKKD